MKRILLVLALVCPVVAVAQPKQADLMGLGMSAELASKLGEEATARSNNVPVKILDSAGTATTVLNLDTSDNTEVNASSGDELELQVGGTNEMTLSATAVTVPSADLVVTAGDVSIVATGKTIEMESGTAASACVGSATATGTTAVTVSTTCAVTGSKIFLSRTSAVAAGVTEPGCWATNIQTGVSFDLDCNDAAEDSTFNWIILHEAP